MELQDVSVTDYELLTQLNCVPSWELIEELIALIDKELHSTEACGEFFEAYSDFFEFSQDGGYTTWRRRPELYHFLRKVERHFLQTGCFLLSKYTQPAAQQLFGITIQLDKVPYEATGEDQRVIFNECERQLGDVRKILKRLRGAQIHHPEVSDLAASLKETERLFKDTMSQYLRRRQTL